MKIALSQGLYAEIDDDDYERVAQYKWHAQKHRSTFYARSSRINGKWLKMHRFIMGIGENKDIQIDHVDGNGLNNKKSNLRICNGNQNQANRGKNKNNKTGYKGVSFQMSASKFRAQVNHGREIYYLGLFTDPAEAARAYDRKALELFGEFANLNFPQERAR